jgi:hypothetical protein
MIQDPQSIFLSSGCFLDAIISGQLGPTAWLFFVLPEHVLSTPELNFNAESQEPDSVFSENGNPVAEDAPRGGRNAYKLKTLTN